MGMVAVQVRGSFGSKPDATFSALEGGHALALTRAIQHLTALLPEAIQNDHNCHSKGIRPPTSDFGVLLSGAESMAGRLAEADLAPPDTHEPYDEPTDHAYNNADRAELHGVREPSHEADFQDAHAGDDDIEPEDA